MKLNLATKKILIVEDYPAMRKAIRDMLHSLKAEYIIEAKDADKALSAMSAHTFDIVLCDYNLGVGKNGQQILEEARLKNIIPFNTIFIIVSSEQTPGMVLGAMENRPDEYLTKPFNAQQLYSRLKKNFTRKKYLLNVEREIARGNPALAIYHCDKLLRENNTQMRMRLLKIRAELALDVDDLQKAYDIYQEILKQRELPWARLGLGIIAFRQNQTETAIEIFEKLIDTNPMFMEGYDWLNKAYQSVDLPLKAQDILIQAVELSPTSILRQKKLAASADKNNSVEIAEQAYKAVLKQGKYSIHKTSRDYSELAKFYSRTNANEQALNVLDDMLKEYTDNPETELRAATLESEFFKQQGDNKFAEQAFAKALNLAEELKNDIPKDLQLDLVKACFLNNEMETAERILDALIKTHIDDDDFMAEILNMQSSIGMKNHSESLMQTTRKELLRINNRGVSLFKQGKIMEAMELFEQAISKMPDNKTIMMNMVKIALHDLKSSGPNKERIVRVQNFIQRATKIGITPDKLAIIQMEFAALTHSRPTQQN